MSDHTQIRNQHLLWRAGFGPRAEDIPWLPTQPVTETYEKLVQRSTREPTSIFIAGNPFDGLVKGLMDAGRLQQLTKEQKKQLRMKSREDLKNLNLRWLEEMVHSESQLREKMAYFWHGHFACREINIFFQQELLDVVRTQALGNFGELLKSVSRSASMLSFLNNQQNRKQHPNENFAREVMELFTMGRGYYTEEDIKEAARAFTGWGFNLDGSFVFRKYLHDEGSKTFLGRTGNFDGDQILEILLEQKQTALFITRKVYRFFVNEKTDEGKINWLADRFYQSNYEISGLLKDIFTSEWFYDPENIGSRIKSPVDLLVGMRRMVPIEFQQEEVQLLYQHVLGQVLFYPPNVAGWPGGQNWIDSSSLMFRLQVPVIIARNQVPDLEGKQDDDVQMGQQGNLMNAKDSRFIEEKIRQRLKTKGLTNEQIERRIQWYRANRQPNQQKEKQAKKDGWNIEIEIDWPVYTQYFSKIPDDELGIAVAALLLQSGTIRLDPFNKFLRSANREAYLRELTIRLMSTPEYQLC